MGDKRMKWGAIYEIDNPCFLADTFVFTKVIDRDYRLYGETIFVKVNSSNKIEEIGRCIEERILFGSIEYEELIKRAMLASKKHIASLKKIDMQFYSLNATDYSKLRR